MAEVTDFRNNVLPYPIYGLPYTISFPILDADGDPVSSAAGLDSEISKNGDTPADCTNEAAEIGSSGTYYLTLTGAELSCQCATVCVKTSTSGAKTTVLTLYPIQVPQVVASKNPQAGDTNQITLAADAGDIDHMWTGYILAIELDGVVQVRTIVGYTASTKVATVVPTWTSDPPDADDVYYIYQPPGAYMPRGTWGPVTAVTGAVGSVTGGVNVTKWTGETLSTPGDAGWNGN